MVSVPTSVSVPSVLLSVVSVERKYRNVVVLVKFPVPMFLTVVESVKVSPGATVDFSTDGVSTLKSTGFVTVTETKGELIFVSEIFTR